MTETTAPSRDLNGNSFVWYNFKVFIEHRGHKWQGLYTKDNVGDRTIDWVIITARWHIRQWWGINNYGYIITTNSVTLLTIHGSRRRFIMWVASGGYHIGGQGLTANKFKHIRAKLCRAFRVWNNGEVLKPSWLGWWTDPGSAKSTMDPTPLTSFTWWMPPHLPCFSPLFWYYCQHMLKNKNAVSLGTRLLYNVVSRKYNCSQDNDASVVQDVKATNVWLTGKGEMWGWRAMSVGWTSPLTTLSLVDIECMPPPSTSDYHWSSSDSSELVALLDVRRQ